VVPPSATSTAPKKHPQEETIMDKPSQDLQEQVVGTQPLKCQKRTTQTTSVSLEAHQPSSSSDHVSTTFYTLKLCLYTSSKTKSRQVKITTINDFFLYIFDKKMQEKKNKAKQ
jgi:hypothetical protein